MSLKVFHLFFTGCTTLLFLFLGVFYATRFSASYQIMELIYALASIALAMGGVVYGIYFMQKYKHLSNL